MKVTGQNYLYQDNKGTSYKQAMNLQDEFMSILITELRYQDPLEPMKEKDFFAQMAQFTTAASVTSLESTVQESMFMFQEGQGRLEEALLAISQHLGEKSLPTLANLIGSSITARYEGEIVVGTMESVTKENGQIYVRCQGKMIPVQNIISFGGSESAD